MTKQKIFRLFFPMKCSKCGKIVPLNKDYCDCYGDRIEFAPPLCPHCAAAEDKCICGTTGVTFNHFSSVFIYDGRIKARMHNLKFNGKKHEAEFFADAMLDAFKRTFPKAEIDAVTFVPMTDAEKKRRGFNQSELMAMRIADGLCRPCAKLTDKIVETAEQHSLNGAERLSNVNHAFNAPDRRGMEGKTILLIDDIKTTGATLFWCQQALLSGGAKDVYCLTAAVSRFLVDD